MEPEQSLLKKMRRGDRQAFEKLVRRHYQRTYSLALGWLGNREAALDISQEVFIRVYRHRERVDPQRPFGAWLYTITRNLCTNVITREKRRFTVFSDLPGHDDPAHGGIQRYLPPIDSGEARMEFDERKKLLWQAINGLKDGDREIIILKEMDNMSYREISEVLAIPPGSVMSRLYYARKRLAERVLKMTEFE